MHTLKYLFQVLVILPAIALSSCAVGGYIGGGFDLKNFNWWIAIIASIIALVVYATRSEKKYKKKMEARFTSLGFVPDYTVLNGVNSMMAIDRKNQKILIDAADGEFLVGFDEIKTVEMESDYAPMSKGRILHYKLHFNTNNFDLPKLTVWFGSRKHLCDEAYAKVSAALNLI